MLISISIFFCSILWVEIIRDSYHALAHIWQPLYRLHVWHHRVFRPDYTVTNETIYQQAQWHNDVPEALVMLLFSFLPFSLINYYQLPYFWVSLGGTIYTSGFLLTALGRALGIPYVDELTDITHRQGVFATIPAPFIVNRPYHWRHHFDDQNAYFCGTFTLVDKVLGSALSLKGKKVTVTGASGTLGQALLKQLHLQGAKVTALTSKETSLEIESEGKIIPIKTITWQIGQENQLDTLLQTTDILILNHGINVHSDRTETAIAKSYEINTFSSVKLMELFLQTVKTNQEIATKELWVNTSEAEVNPAFSPLYELSKRTLGDLVTLRRLDSPCIIRKLILGPFKSNLNPIGVMSAQWVAKQIIQGAKRDFRNIIVTINPITFLLFPIKEVLVHWYFRLFTRRS